jgi:hypothetical protein
LVASGRYQPILEALLLPEGLGYAEKPKALIPFHRYPEGLRTALEEHLAEAVRLVRDQSALCRLHFTVSVGNETEIRASLESLRAKPAYAASRFRLSTSVQDPATDTLAVDEGDRPSRNPDGSWITRPAGHGALVENLSRSGGDLVLIKNIDNVVPDRLKPGIIAWRRILGGYLVMLQERVFDFLRRLRKRADPPLLRAAAEFAEQNLGLRLPERLARSDSTDRGTEGLADYLIRILNRPSRVCAMVRNTGEPGGGPFWVRHADGSLRLQIVEQPQINMHDEGQRNIAARSTHFNPTDLVCGLLDADGRPFRLADFVDESAYLITAKSKQGKILKALELPGLWNGSMAEWNTVFVEVPVENFNPVKTVNDLLRSSHQNS